ncbi:GtrA family protein [Candidatus Parcubacteria bacterium]|nr:MAG: GtrA family protein [Candidatus Parcubacteria bacterium]
MSILFWKHESGIKGWLKSLVKKFNRFPYFIIVGAIGFFINFFITLVFTEFFHLWYMFSYIFGSLCSWIFNFVMNSKVTFKGHNIKHTIKKYFFYIEIYGIIGLGSLAIMYILTSVIGVHYLLSIVIVAVTNSLATYSFNKKIIFKYDD